MVTNTVIGALAYLAGICDGARDSDGRGFSGADTDFGRDLASKGRAYGLTERQHASACKLVHKYRKQLRAAGYDVEALASEAFERPVTGVEAPARHQVAAWGEGGYARINRYAGRCCGCGARVEPGDGVTRKGEDGKWAVRCSPACGAPDPAAELDRGTDAHTTVQRAGWAPPDEPMVRIRAVGPNGGR